jgi:uncharacterized protein (TIGR04551 family)
MLIRFRPLPLASCVLLVAGSAFAQNAEPPAKAVPQPPAPAPAKPPAPAAAAPTPAAAPVGTPPSTTPPVPGPADDAAPEDAEAAEPDPGPPPAPLPPSLAGSGATSAGDAVLLAERDKPRPPPPVNDETAIYTSDWWTHARPIIEIHGLFRFRAELFHHFSLTRVDAADRSIWPRPADDRYTPDTGSPPLLDLCTEEEAGTGNDTSSDNLRGCKNGTQSSANIRLRLNPEIHISDNLRVMSQIDLLDNLVLGSTPASYGNQPADGGGYMTTPRDAYSPIGFYDETTSPPRSGINSLSDSISVKRAWAEYSTPVGELRFGRMPFHWGLGMVYHSGDGHDDDYQSTIDRLQFVTSIKPLELYISGAWDFPNEGATSQNLSIPNGQAYDVAQLDDVDQYVFNIARRKSPELQKLALARGEVVINGGVQLTYRTQLLANDNSGDCSISEGAATLGCNPGELRFARRNANYWLPDLWLQILYKRFRFEVEAATVQGSIENDAVTPGVTTEGYDLSEWGFATELEQLVAEDRLRLGLNVGWASGDADVDGLTPSGGGATPNQHGDDTIETFRFNPSYRVDLILHRNLLNRVQGTYYFRPSLSYDFLKDVTGQRLGGGVAAIWSRASQFVQSPGHERDLGIEFDASIYFQSKDGALNDDPLKMGGFFARLEYGILFPMAGMGYPDAKAARMQETSGNPNIAEIRTAQIVRLYLGAMF